MKASYEMATRESFYHMDFNIGFYCLQVGHMFIKLNKVVTDVVNNVTYSCKSNTHVVITLFYYMKLSTGKRRRHMIKAIISKTI